MVQFKCPECGKKFSTPATKCPQCGAEINKEGSVTIINLLKDSNRCSNPSIVIEGEQRYLGTLNDENDKLEFACDKETKLYLTCRYVSLAYSQCIVKPGDVVYLTYNNALDLDCLRPIIVHKDYKLPEIDHTNKKKINPVYIGLLGLVLVGLCVWLCVPNSREKETSESYSNEQFVGDYKEKSYPDLERQINKYNTAFAKFNREIDLIGVKARSPQYQGIMAQKLFWDANNALDELNKEGEKVEKLMRKYGLAEQAREHKEKRKDLEREYNEQKRRAKGYR